MSSRLLDQVHTFANYGKTANVARFLSTRRHHAESEDMLLNTSRHRVAVAIGCVHFDDKEPYQRQQVSSLHSTINNEEEKAEIGEGTIAQIREIFSCYFEEAAAVTTAVITTENIKRKKKKNSGANLCSINGTMPWSQAAILERKGYFCCGNDKFSISNVILFLECCLRGIAQVYFQNNPISGLLILVGLFIQSTNIAIHGALALISGNLMAHLLGFDIGLIRSGLFGYNSFLVGLAIATFEYSSHDDVNYSFAIIFASSIFAGFSSILFVVLGKLLVPYKSPPLTAPFNIVTLLFLLSTAEMNRVAYAPVRDPSLPDYTTTTNSFLYSYNSLQFAKGVLRGIGQVYLANNLLSCCFIWFGICICSRISAFAAIAGSCIGTATAFATGVPLPSIANGMYGFNASLTVTAILMFYAPGMGSIILSLIAGVLTTFCQQAFSTLLLPWGLPFMTLPFVLATLPFIILQGTTSAANNRMTAIFAIPLDNVTTPEDHIRRIKVLNDGYHLFYSSIQPTAGSSSGRKERISIKFSRKMSQHLSDLSSVNIDSDNIIRNDSANNDIDIDKNDNAMRMHNEKNGVNDPIINSKVKMHQSILINTCCRFFQQYIVRKSKHKSKLIESVDDIFRSFGAKGVKTETQKQKEGRLHMNQFLSILQKVDLTDGDGIEFSTAVFHLMDFTKSQTMNRCEFIAFCEVSMKLKNIRQKVAKFIQFIDNMGYNDCIDVAEIDAGLEYLGHNSLTENERTSLIQATAAATSLRGAGTENYSEAIKIDVVDLINFITVAKLKLLVEDYHQDRA